MTRGGDRGRDNEFRQPSNAPNHAAARREPG